MAIVYIWSSNMINTRPGHASLCLDTGTYISFWPKEDNKAKYFKTWPAVSQSPFELVDKYEVDVELEGYTANEVIEINRSKLNIEQIEEWWRTYIPVYHFFRNNCCDVVMEALKVGGAHSFVEPTKSRFLTTPDDVKQYCIKLSQK